MGATAETVNGPSELEAAFLRAKASDKTYVICMKVDPYEGWTTEGHAWWEVGTPHITKSDKVHDAHVDWESSRHKQRKGV
jgi:3D-(3,5/4)-trihydroxycyclohexane-1,2-dione acylhydrolase (decyclizing)